MLKLILEILKKPFNKTNYNVIPTSDWQKYERNLAKYPELEHLATLGDNPPSSGGICYWLYRNKVVLKLDECESERVVSLVCETWEHYSGNVHYPVPSADGNIYPHVFYMEASNNGNLWTGKQLEYRKSLIKHIITNWEQITCVK